jgi:hypothetical protein
MTKKDYKILAEVIKYLLTDSRNDINTIERLNDYLRLKLKQDNSNFNDIKWFDYINNK